MPIFRRTAGAVLHLIQIRIHSRVLVFTILAAVVCAQNEIPEGYIINITAGKAYKVMFQAQQWTHARDKCEDKGATLAVPSSEAEFKFLQRLIRGMYYPQGTSCQNKLLLWLGIYSSVDFTSWRTVDGEDINETGFSTWANNDVALSDDPQEPHCAGMDAASPGLRRYWCHLRQPYICQILVTPYGAPDFNNMNEDIEHFLHERHIYH